MKKNNDSFFSKLKNSRSIVFPKVDVYEEIRKVSFEFLKSNSYKQVIFPSYDYENTFTKSLGEDTDIVQKEMFTFLDKKGRNLALRPEGTACVAKMVFQGEIAKFGQVEKIFYWSNMFRYERPQKGRYREFWQLGVELINAYSEFTSDCEIVYIANSLLEKIEISDYNFHINYLGDDETRKRYSEDLKKSLSLKIDYLCTLCKKRYHSNPLRIVDCQNCGNMKEIPDYDNFLSEEELESFEKIKNFMTNAKINFNIDKKLVRGISYYSGLVFECRTKNEKKSILGGGRYDSLILTNSESENLSKKKQSSIGFAIGIDRLVDFCKQERIKKLEKEEKTDLLLISFSENNFHSALLLKDKLQKDCSNLVADIAFYDKNKNLSKILLNYNPHFSIFFGEKESIVDQIPVINHRTNCKSLVKKELLADWLNDQLKTIKKDIN